MMRSATLVVLLFVAACSDDDGPKDAAIPTTDIDNGPCGNMVRFTGEYVDWDNDSNPCGIFGARFQVQGGGAMNTTAPNGRFDLCVPDQPITFVDITPPTDGSQCTVPPGAIYSMPGIAVANKAVIFASGGFFSGRAFPMGRQTFDPTKAQVFVHVNGTPRAVSLAAAHGPTQAVTANAWEAGDIGHEVYFPDVDPAGGSTMLMVAGVAVGTGSIPLIAGTMTSVSIVAK
jgi:hypothetical protein